MGRRDFLQTGLGALGGLGLTSMLGLQSRAAVKSDTRCIFIWLDGGPSHYETFDPKPDAPVEIQGEIKATATSVPGVWAAGDLTSPMASVARVIAAGHVAASAITTGMRPSDGPTGIGVPSTMHCTKARISRSRSGPAGV